MRLNFFTPAPASEQGAGESALMVRDAGDNDPVLLDIARRAAQLCGVGVGAVTILAGDHQHVVARHGVSVRQTPRALSFCGHLVSGSDLSLVVEDAAADPRFAGNPLVTGAPFVRFYAGAPLFAGSSAAAGAVCVMGTEPKAQLTPDQKLGLAALGRQATARLAELKMRG